jgi:RES domain-containing protein
MLEILAHGNIGRIPATHGYVIAEVPDGVSVETQNADSLPSGWDLENSTSARAFGDLWLQESRTAILVVPSVVARLDANALVNPAHPDANRLTVSLPEMIVWDNRLFKKA